MSRIRRSTLRSVLGKVDLDAPLSERERLNEDLQQIIDEQTEPWGIKVTTVEIRDVGIPSTMQRAMARAGRGGARATRQDHPRRGRAPGLRQAFAGGRDPEPDPGGDAAPVPADALRARRRAALGDRVLVAVCGRCLETTASAPPASAPAGDDDPAALAPGPRDNALAGTLPAGLSRRDSTPG
jgi:hypothetical protein